MKAKALSAVATVLLLAVNGRRPSFQRTKTIWISDLQRIDPKYGAGNAGGQRDLCEALRPPGP